jgi:TfoX/Sxy family transcriptional regulator of competence genes
MRHEDEDLAAGLLERLAPLGALRAKRMFGGVGLYCDELFFGLIDDGVPYFKVDETSVALYRAKGAAPFRPFPDKPPMGGYYEVPTEVQEQDDELRAWAARAVEVARAKAKPRRARATAKPRLVPVEKLPNLGPKSAAWLRSVGIRTRADLEALGAVRAFRRVSAAGHAPSLNLLYALEGALLDLRWDRLSAAVKANLRARAEALEDPADR